MHKEVIFILPDEFADWEGAFIAASLNQGVAPGCLPKYTVRTMSVDGKAVASIGGFRVLPDYGIETMQDDYAALILVGGKSWFTPKMELVAPLAVKAVRDNKPVAGICNASVFLGMCGLLDNVKHTSNTLDYLKTCAGDKYRGAANYVEAQAVRDSNIITANGAGQLEFCREILYALEADLPENIEANYLFYKNGFCPA